MDNKNPDAASTNYVCPGGCKDCKKKAARLALPEAGIIQIQSVEQPDSADKSVLKLPHPIDTEPTKV